MSKQNPTILERIEMLEKASEQLYKLFENNFNEVRKTLSAFTETMTAIMAANGPDFEPKVVAELKKIRNARFEAEQTRSKAVIDQLLDNKVVELADSIDSDSIVTGRYLDKTSGELTEPGYQQFEFKYFVEDAKPALLGKTVGFVYDTPAATANFEITGIYKYTKPGAKTETTDLSEPVVPTETLPSAEAAVETTADTQASPESTQA